MVIWWCLYVNDLYYFVFIDFFFVVIVIVGGIGCGIMVIFICIFVCWYWNGVSKVNFSKLRNKSEVEFIFGFILDGNSVDVDFIELNKGDVLLLYLLCRKVLLVINLCECDGDLLIIFDKRFC